MAALREIVSFSRLGDFWGILREVDPKSIERDAARVVRLVLCGPANVGKRRMAAALSSGSFTEPLIGVYDMPSDVSVALPDADAYIYVTSSMIRQVAVEREHLRQLSRRNAPVLVLLADTGEEQIGSLRDTISATSGIDPRRILAIEPNASGDLANILGAPLLTAVPSLALPLGRHLPALRAVAADRLVRETARVNAEFAALSSLPGIVPIIGGIAAAGADMLVLTKNQAMLVLKLATVYGRPIDNSLQVVTEIAPIIGAGVIWRTIARNLVALIPGPLAIAPKVGVAYVGTYVVGKTAQYYYRVGQRPSPELLDRFRHEAVSQLQTLIPMIGELGKHLPKR
jgi:uncharacterized protein (DUF697 family)